MEEEMLTYAQASKLLNVKVNTLYGLVATNRIPHLRLGRRLVRFRQSEIRTWLDAHSVPASNQTKPSHE